MPSNGEPVMQPALDGESKSGGSIHARGSARAMTSSSSTLRWKSCLVTLAVVSVVPHEVAAQQRFADDFERDLLGWEIRGEGAAFVEESDDPDHGRVLVLRPQGDVYALVRGSQDWGGVRMEGDVLFPDEQDDYLGFIYAFRERDGRADFGLIYIKGNGSYLRVNPHRDFNVGRTLYEEYRTPLVDDAAIRTGEWQHFKLEVVGNEAHVYVGDMDVPQLTFSYLELEGGAVGLQPRSVGGDVWVDNISVSSIPAFAYVGPPLPAPHYRPDSLLTDWQVAGPFARTVDHLARHPDSLPQLWRLFSTDGRGAVISATVVEYHGPHTVAYFRTTVQSAVPGPATLHLSTVDDLAIWINGRFHWFVQRDGLAWWDFWFNEEHRGRRIPIELRQGANEIVIRVRGGVYASGGFFARLER